MKFSDITGEDILSEAPMGFMNTVKTAAKAINPFSLKGRSQSRGQFTTGRTANKLYADYYNYLGKSGQKATPTSIISFLTNFGYSPSDIDTAKSELDKIKIDPKKTAQPIEPSLDPEKSKTSVAPKPQQKPQSPEEQERRKKELQGRRAAGTNFAAAGGKGFSQSQASGPNPNAQPSGMNEDEQQPEQELSKQQIDNIFNKIIQVRATANSNQSNNQSSNRISGRVMPNDNALGQTSNTSPSNTTSAPRIGINDVLNFYKANPQERPKVKDGIAKIDQTNR